MKIIDQSQKKVIAENAWVADTLLARMKGLLGRTHLDSNEALVITRCQSIHMLFMKFPIDAIFVDRHNCVVGLVRRIQPFRLSPCFFKAVNVIECVAGTIDQKGVALGDQISFEDRF